MEASWRRSGLFTDHMEEEEWPRINGLNADGTAALGRQGDAKTHANMYWLHAKYKGMHFLDKNPTDVTGSAPPLENESKYSTLLYYNTTVTLLYSFLL